MAISTGDKLPDSTLLLIGAEGPEQVSLMDKTAGRKVIIFGLPGAFTGTCSEQHVPSFIRTKDALAAKGVDEVICVSVNDPFVMSAWSKATGAEEAGITMLGDADGALTAAIGMDFDAAPVGFKGRSKRYSMVVEDGTVTILHAEENPGICEASSGEAILEAL